MTTIRNPFFTGREELLQTVREALQRDQVVALSGPAGVGKTEFALAYADRYAETYRWILWLNAATHATLLASIAGLEHQLELSRQPGQSQQSIIEALRNWLMTHHDYLLILDNTEDAGIVQTLFPARPAGHLLLLAEQPVAEHQKGFVAIGSLPPQDGVHLLLARSGQRPTAVVLSQAREERDTLVLELARELNGQPLALELAAAYIRETQSTVHTYLQSYRESGRLAESTEPLETVWRLSFARLEMAHPAAADLLRMCAFLAPEDIPRELFQEQAAESAPAPQKPVQTSRALDEAIEVLLAYAVVKRGTIPQTVSMHRLVQTLLQERLSPDEQRRWVERMLPALHRLLPPITGETLGHCLRYVSHVQQLATLSASYERSLAPAAEVFTWTASVFYALSAYQEAISWLSRALAIWEQVLGVEHPTTLTVLHNLAGLYEKQGAYEQAEDTFRRVLAIRERLLGEEHPDTALSLNNLAHVCVQQHKQEEAERLYQRALDICVTRLGSQHPVTVLVLYNLALLYIAQRKFIQAEGLLDRVSSSREQMLGLDHLETVKALHHLAVVCMAQSKWQQAEAIFRRILPIYERILGWAHPDTSDCFMHLANLAALQGRLQEAEGMYKHLLERREQALGQSHPDTLGSMNALAGVYLALKHYEQAEQLLQRSLAISERALGQEHMVTLLTLGNLAITYVSQEKHEQAAPLLRQLFTSNGINLPTALSGVPGTEPYYQELMTALEAAHGRGRFHLSLDGNTATGGS